MGATPIKNETHASNLRLMARQSERGFTGDSLYKHNNTNPINEQTLPKGLVGSYIFLTFLSLSDIAATNFPIWDNPPPSPTSVATQLQEARKI